VISNNDHLSTYIHPLSLLLHGSVSYLSSPLLLPSKIRLMSCFQQLAPFSPSLTSSLLSSLLTPILHKQAPFSSDSGPNGSKTVGKKNKKKYGRRKRGNPNKKQEKKEMEEEDPPLSLQSLTKIPNDYTQSHLVI